MKNNKPIYILGISAFYHDSAAVLLKNGEIVAASQEERFTRKKNDESFPVNAIKYCLKESGLPLYQLDAVVFYEKPFPKFERLLSSYYLYAPHGLKSFLTSMPVWLKEKLFLKKLIMDKLKEIENIRSKDINLLFSNHHLSHAASAFYPSPFNSAAILTIDGVGEWATASIARGKGNKIQTLVELKFPHSLGLLYSAFTYYLGFEVNSGEYKLMGLAPYGDPNSQQLEEFKTKIKSEIVSIKDDGSIFLNQKYFNYIVGLEMIDDGKWKRLFGFQRKKSEENLEQHHCNLALAIQQIAEEIVLKMAGKAKELTGEKRICLAGGVALNCVANSKLLKSGIFEDLWVQPAAGDAGGALGAAFAAYYIYFAANRRSDKKDKMGGALLGPDYGLAQIEEMIRRNEATYKYFDDFSKLCQVTARLIAKGKVVGWYQGRMEWGPRSLGNRSILGDARNKNMQKKLNLYIKYRESFRPFAPSVLLEDVSYYFKLNRQAPYMLLIADIVERRRKPLPPNYHQLPLMEKLYFIRSDLPAVTHLDYSARVQTVDKETNERYWLLLKKFKTLTGCGVIVNTSFNVRDEPIVCTPEDAYRCFMKTEMDYLVVGNFLFDKNQQMLYDQ